MSATARSRPAKTDVEAIVRSVTRTLEAERDGIATLLDAIASDLGPAFAEAVSLAAAARGRIVVTGMGKSGHVGRKIASTLASTGTPASFVHPAEASHGDLGMIQPEDIVLALSWSGETRELADILSYAKRRRVTLIAFTASPDSTLARQADLSVVLPRAREACPNGQAPTTSTTMMLAAGDAFAVALLEGRGFSALDFHAYHPGGRLGAELKHVRAVMHSGDSLPVVPLGTPMSDAIPIQSAKGFGCVIVTEPDGRLAGIVTDGDLRRHMGPDLLGRPVEQVMTRGPTVVTEDTLQGEALEIAETRGISALVVVAEDRPVGLVRVLDLLRAGVA